MWAGVVPMAVDAAWQSFAVERARELLAHTDMRVAEIARAVGFDDEAYFARRFRQWYDVSPREFRLRSVAA